MSDIAAELAKLHILKGADYSRQVERIARMSNFHPVEGESQEHFCIQGIVAKQVVLWIVHEELL